MSTSEVVSSPRVAPDQWFAFGGIWRLTFRRLLAPGQWLPILGMLALLALVSASAVGTGDRGKFFAWTADFYIAFLVPILAFLSGAGAMRDDLKSGTVDYVFTRPVRRPAFIVFRYLSQVACAQIVYLLALGVLLGVGVYKQIPDLLAPLPLLVLAQFLMVSAFVALGFLCGLLTSRYLIVGIAYGGIIEGGVGNIPTQLSRFSMTHHAREIMERSTNELSRLSAEAAALYVSVGSVLLFVLLALAGTALLFARRELAGAPARDNA